MSRKKYDVFLSFHGEDTRDFISHLRGALTQKKVHTYIDDRRLEKGDEISQALIRAIQDSHVSVVIFSENYASSKCCLGEITEILQCRWDHGQILMPVFYKVEPSHVRKQTGSYKEAFAKHEQDLNNSDDKLHKWRCALTEAANLAGWDSQTSRNESEFIEDIVQDVLTKLDIRFLPITAFPVGLESRVQEVIEFLVSQSSQVCMVGIWGMGGLGKTTTAKAIYNQINCRFEGKSFIENIREVCEKDSRGHIHLQEQLLSDVIKTKLMKIHSIAAGTAMINRILSAKRTLVVLDDVTTFEQLEALCGNRKWFGQGSVIIITTRDARLLNNNLLKVDYLYKMKEMDQKESLELFSWHAFREASPREDFNELSRSLAAYCGQLPLALEVLGSDLHKRKKQDWISVLSKLERIPNRRVQEILRISYDDLDEELIKVIFLDICCFFIGKDRAYVTEILNGCGLPAYIGIEVLIERSLLIVEKNNKLGMHDLLRDMGREFVRLGSPIEPGKRCRLWSPKDVHYVLTNNTGTGIVEGLVLKLQRTGRVCFNTNAFKDMKNLRLLQLDSVELVGNYGHLSRKLTWVYWRGCALKYIPSEFYQGNLVVLDLKHSNIIQVWKEDKLLKKLKILNLSHSWYLENTPDFSKLPNLEKLILKDCPSLREVHQSIGDLSKILLINLQDCTSLSYLPRTIYKLKSLETLIISGCSKIDKFEEDIVQMESLATLIAKDTAVQEVPYSIVELKSIGYVSLCGYEGLSRDVFPSLIWSWMSPTMNPLSRFPLFGAMSLSRVSINLQNDYSGYLSPLLSHLSKPRSLWIQCHSETQLTQALKRSLVTFAEPVTTSNASQVSDFSLRSLLIGMGSSHLVIDTLGKRIAEGLASNDSCNFFLPGDNYPSWLAYTGEGPSVSFEVPDDRGCCMKGITLCLVYSSAPEKMATESLISVLIINFTKFTIQIFKRDTVMSFNDEDWQGVISNLSSGDNVEIFVAFGHGLTVKETAVYLIYGQSNAMEIEPAIIMEDEPSIKVKLEPSPQVNVLSLPEVNVHPSANVEMEPANDQFQFAASSSSSSTSVMSLKKFDVFLSFHGDDTRDNFTSHLHGALSRAKVETYIDYWDEKGDEISQALIKAIQESHVSVVIFSENYASSKWCLDEISVILECRRDHGQVVLPVFYRVDPSDVRKQTGSYKEAFAKHEKYLSNSGDKLHKWRCALNEAANLAGWDSQNRNESQFIKDIVEDVLQKLYPIQLKGVVGLEENYAGIESLLKIGSTEVFRVIGIWGMGGVGKTTLAWALHAKLSCQFEGHCFLEHVREQAEKNGLDSLRNRLFSELLEEENICVESHFVTRRLRRTKVLIVLDDVATSEQLDYLISDCFAPGSRVIVTTRDKHIFSQVTDIYEVMELNANDSLQLFCLNAFGEVRPKFGYEELSQHVVAYSKGNPLALKVLGTHLRSKNIEAWKSELRKLHKIQDVNIHNVLKFSFDCLDRNEQEIFLDIACFFFKGKSRDSVTSPLDVAGIKNLIDKGWEMHDLIHEMGREIVHQESIKDPGRRSRLWDREEVYDVLKNDKWGEGCNKILSDELRHVEWPAYCLESLPHSNIKKLWNGVQTQKLLSLPQNLSDLAQNFSWLDFSWPFPSLITMTQKFSCLTTMNLSHNQSITAMPSVSDVPSLRQIRLDNCKNLNKVHESVGLLKKLAHVSASGCAKLRDFPRSMHSTSLEVLDLNSCTSLEHFPEIVNNMTQPLKIYMMNTAIEKLPDSIGKLIGLVYINMSGSRKLRYLPHSLFMLKNIATFKIGGCSNLGESFIKFAQSSAAANGPSTLKTLYFGNGGLSDEDLHAILNSFPKLEELIASDNNFVSLPECIKDSVHLTSLIVSDCRKLQKVPECTILRILNVHRCVKLEEITELPSTIQKVDARYCCSLTIETIDMLWSQVKKEIRGLEVMMYRTKIPKWFDWRVNGGNPHFWARGKFPIVALALFFSNLKGTASHSRRQLIELHLFINGQCVPCKSSYNFRMEAEHVLVCDLRLLFSEEEWQGLDAFLEHDWNLVQVSYKSSQRIYVSSWGVYMYKQETNLEDVRFMYPGPENSDRKVPSRDPQQEEIMMVIFRNGMRDGLVEAHKSFPTLDIDTTSIAAYNTRFEVTPLLAESEVPEMNIYREGIISGLEEAKLSFPTLNVEAIMNVVLSMGVHKVVAPSSDDDPLLQEFMMVKEEAYESEAKKSTKYSDIPNISSPTTFPARGLMQGQRKMVEELSLEDMLAAMLIGMDLDQHDDAIADEDYVVKKQIHFLMAFGDEISRHAKDVLEGKVLNDNSTTAWISQTMKRLEDERFDKKEMKPPVEVEQDSTSGHHQDDAVQRMKVGKEILEGRSLNDNSTMAYFDVGEASTSGHPEQQQIGNDVSERTLARILQIVRSPMELREPLGQEMAHLDGHDTLYWKLMEEQKALLKKFEELENESNAAAPGELDSWKQQYHELMEKFNTSQSAEFNILGEHHEKLGAAFTGRDEELRKLYDVSKKFQDKKSAIYLNGLRDGLLEAQAILLALDMDPLDIPSTSGLAPPVQRFRTCLCFRTLIACLFMPDS